MQHFGPEGSLDTTKAIPPADRGTAGSPGREGVCYSDGGVQENLCLNFRNVNFFFLFFRFAFIHIPRYIATDSIPSALVTAPRTLSLMVMECFTVFSLQYSFVPGMLHGTSTDLCGARGQKRKLGFRESDSVQVKLLAVNQTAEGKATLSAPCCGLGGKAADSEREASASCCPLTRDPVRTL